MSRLFFLVLVLARLSIAQTVGYRDSFDEQWNDLSQWIIITGVAPTLANHTLTTHLFTDEILTLYTPSNNFFKLYADNGDSTYTLEFKNVTFNGTQYPGGLIGTASNGNFILDYPSQGCDSSGGMPAHHICTDSPQPGQPARVHDTGIAADGNAHNYKIRITTLGATAGACPTGYTLFYYIDGALVDTVPVEGCIGNDDLDIKGLLSAGDVFITSYAADAVDDFSIASNPNGDWSYGYTTGLGGTFHLHDTPEQNTSYMGSTLGIDRWCTAAIDPTVLCVSRNLTGSTIQGTSFIYPPDMLHVHPTIPDIYDVVRWTVPQSNQYTFQGLYSGLDYYTSVADTDVHVLLNATTDLMPVVVLHGYGTSAPFGFTRNLNAGDIVDVAVGVGPSGLHQNDSTGLKATITARAPVATGTINVTTNLAAATFTITGPATYSGSGVAFNHANAPTGTYTITYGAISCYATPASETKTLSAHGTISFTGGIYSGQATVSVNVSPIGASSATFSISPPVPGMRNTSPYPIIQPNVVPQAYTVTFNQVPGFGSPQPQTLTPDNSCKLPFSGVYTANLPTGTAILSVALNTNGGGVTISSTNNSAFVPITGVGSFSAQVPAGSYQITFSDLLRYYKPAPQRVVLNTNDSVTVHGLYQRLLVVAFTGFNTAPAQSNCLPLIGNVNRTYSPGAGIEYTIPQTDAGMTEIVPEIQGLVPGVFEVPALKPGITGDAFTFYGKDTNGVVKGDACTPPGGNPDHMDAENWLMEKNPTPFDRIVIIGHSYGGNRARLFVEQLKKNRSLIADLLVTVDAIEWSACSIVNAVAANNPLSAAASACNQTLYTSTQIPVSNARSSFSFYQTIGVISVFPYVMGYCDPGPCSSSSTTDQLTHIDHLDIDKDSGVHLMIRQLMLNLIRNPSVVPTAGSPTRSSTQLVVPIMLSVTGISAATAVQVTSASLNGVSALNLAGLSNLGDLPPGSSLQLSLTFPGSAVESGKTVTLALRGQQTSGQNFLLSKRITVP